MKSRWIIALLVALVCMAAPAMALEPSTPFAISGHILDADNNPCNGTWVRITNTNTSVSWNAENSSTSNYYQLALDSDDVSVDNVLSIEASGCSQSKTVEHTVTQGEIGGGWFSENITLEAMTTYYGDADGDGYGDPANTTEACAAPAGYVTDNTDCDDTNAAVNPGATEVCNGIDDDCDTLVDDADPDCAGMTTYYQDADGDTYGNPAVSQDACAAPAGYVTDNTDCNDNDNTVYPGATELCDGKDNDCVDGVPANEADADSDGVRICGGDCNDGDATVWQLLTGYTDNDGDGYGIGNAQQVCSGASLPSGYATQDGDCDDTNAAVNPGATEVCDDGIDNDCDGLTDCNDPDCPPCPPDLEITDIWTELKRIGRNANTTIIWYNITNNGDTTAGRTYSNLTVDDNPQPRNDGVGKLTPGQTRTEKFTYKGDPHNITVCADCRCVVTESNETNNCLSTV